MRTVSKQRVGSVLALGAMIFIVAACSVNIDTGTNQTPQSGSDPNSEPGSGGVHISSSVSWKPPFLPVKLVWDDQGLSVEGEQSIITPIGTFGIGESVALTSSDYDSLILIIRDRNRAKESAYEISNDEEIAVDLDGGAKIYVSLKQVVIDVTDTPTKAIVLRRKTDITVPAATFNSQKGISVGSTVEVLPYEMGIRANPGKNEWMWDTAVQGKQLYVQGGPAFSEGSLWWQVSGWNTKNIIGWASESYLKVASTIANINVGSEVQVNYDDLNIRSSPSPNSDVVTTLHRGRTMQVIGGPQDVNGRSWWQVTQWDNSGRSGWCPDKYIKPTQ